MLVYVININGQPLMPTSRCSKVRKLLKNGKAKVVKRVPFTIQLLYETTNIVQEVTLGVDCGSKVVGVSATTKDKELHSQELYFCLTEEFLHRTSFRCLQKYCPELLLLKSPAFPYSELGGSLH